MKKTDSYEYQLITMKIKTNKLRMLCGFKLLR
jgi:hypothetical protein